MIGVTRTYPEPTCLTAARASGGDYGCEGVLRQLQRDARNKCYICEQRNITSINVEHFKPHQGDPSLKYDWENLLFACFHCNNTKLDKYFPMLNCTDQSTPIIDWISYHYVAFPKPRIDVIPVVNSQDTLRTVNFLNDIHHGTTPRKVIEAENLLKLIQAEIIDFLDYVLKNRTEEYGSEEVRKKLQFHLSPDSGFTAIKVWLVRSNKKMHAELSEFLWWTGDSVSDI